MSDLQVKMSISLITEQDGQEQEAELILAALPLQLVSNGYVSRRIEVITAGSMPKEVYNILSNTIPRLAGYVTEITKNPAGNGTTIRQNFNAPGGIEEALKSFLKKPKLDS